MVRATDIRPDVHERIQGAMRAALDEAERADRALNAETLAVVAQRAGEILGEPGAFAAVWDAHKPEIGFVGSCLALARKRGWRHR